MKTAFLVSILFFSISCSTQKEIIENGISASETVDIVKGTVHMDEKGCPIYIISKIDGASFKMYPVNLEDQFKIDGLKIKFSYNLSRAMQPENCQVDKVVSVENVSK
ncbi:MAG: hypothetical protein RI883_172 [Bacteroidota bacterium]|jgi:hypothetical protein